MINKIAVLNAEKALFNLILSRNLSLQYDAEVKKIINVYVQDDEIRNIMNVFEMTAEDFEIIYNHLLNDTFLEYHQHIHFHHIRSPHLISLVEVDDLILDIFL